MDIADWLSRQAGSAAYFSHEEDKFMEAAETIRRLRNERDALQAERDLLKAERDRSQQSLHNAESQNESLLAEVEQLQTALIRRG